MEDQLVVKIIKVFKLTINIITILGPGANETDNAGYWGNFHGCDIPSRLL